MNFDFVDKIVNLIPGIKNPSTPLTFREKLKWTAIVISVYLIMFSTPAFGVNISALNNPLFTVINTIFAARIGTLVTVGIGPIVLASIILQMLQGAGVFKMDLNSPEQKAKFQGMQKGMAMIIAVIEAVIFTSTTITLTSPAYFGIVAVQLAISAIIIIYLDEIMTKYGITSGINLFIASGVAFAIVAGTGNILIPEALATLHTGGATAIPQTILDFGPLLFAIIVFLISIYVLDMKIELPLVFSQFRGIGGRLPIPFLYASVLPVILATSLTISLSVWLQAIAVAHAGVLTTSGGLDSLAYYVNQSTGTGTTTKTLYGGLIYFIQPLGYTPYASNYGGTGGYGAYFTVLATYTRPLYPPWGGAPLMIPEWVHFIIYALVLVVLCVLFGRFWTEMTGQGSKDMAGQLQDAGMQIPGFRRDPRMIESVLDRYIPTITILSSITVALIAAFASITGAIGNGMGILLTAGIMYGVYQQLEQEHMIEDYPALNKLLS